MKFKIEYKLEAHGWADLVISNGEVAYEFSVSYVNDSLRELAQSAIDLKGGLVKTKVVFMGEPGELQLLVTVISGEAFYEARLFDDWASWGKCPESEYEVVLAGKCNPSKFIQQIITVLHDIHQNIGVEKYKELWIEHEFPLKQYKVLLNE